MPAPPIQQGAIGVIVRRTIREHQTGVVIDLSAASGITFVLKNPRGVVTTHAGTFASGGADGIIQWTTAAATDFGEAGRWMQQVEYIKAGGTFKTQKEVLMIEPNLR